MFVCFYILSEVMGKSDCKNLILTICYHFWVSVFSSCKELVAIDRECVCNLPDYGTCHLLEFLVVTLKEYIVNQTDI